MKQLFKKGALVAVFASVCILGGLVLSGPACADDYSDVTAFVNNYEQQYVVTSWWPTWDQYLGENFNRSQFEWELANHFPGVLTDQQITQFTDILATGDKQKAYEYLHEVLVPNMAAQQMNEPDSTPQKTLEVLMNTVILPPAKTLERKKADSDAAKQNMPRTLGGAIRYDWVKIGPSEDRDSGGIPGVTVGMAWDVDQASYGFVIPYDHLDFDFFNADRVGAIGFYKYYIPLDGVSTLGLTASGSYMDFNTDNFGAVNYYGLGAAVSYQYESEMFVPGAALAYQYTKDSSENEHTYQHLLKVGTNCGVRIGKQAIVNGYVTWTKDISDWLPPGTDNNYFDVGLEGTYDVSEVFGLTLGYKKVLDMDNYQSDMLYVGTAYQF